MRSLLALLLTATAASAALPADYKGRPFEDDVYKCGPANIPGIVQCAFYDLGGEGIAYHDTDATNNGSGVLNRQPLHERAHASEYIQHFREHEGVDISFVKDFADLNHPNLVSPAPNQLYIGWTADGEWVNYTVNVREAGTYRVFALYSHQPNAIEFDINGRHASTCRLPVETGNWHTWNYAQIGTLTFDHAGLQLLTFHYNSGNNFAFFVFDRVDAGEGRPPAAAKP